MRLNTKRKLIDEIQEQMQEPDVNHKISIKPKAIQKKQKQLRFMQIASDIMAKKGLGNQEKAGLKRKESIANQMTQTISSLDHEFEVDVKVVIPKKTRGKSGRILDGTQLIKEIVIKQQKDKDGSRPINQKYKSQKKSKNKLRQSKQSRDDLFKQLKKCQLKKKSSELTSQEIRQTFQKTSLQDMVSFKKVEDKNQSTNMIKSKKKDKVKVYSQNQEQSQSQSQNISIVSQSFDDNSMNSSISESFKNISQPNKKQKFKRIKPKCTFIEEQAEQSGSQVSSGQESEEDSQNSLNDLVNNDVVINQQNEAEADKKRLQLEAADDLAIIQKIYKGQLFKKKSLPQLLPSEKIRQFRQNQQKQKYAKQLQQLIEKPKIIQQNVLAEVPRTNNFIDYTLQQQKQVFQNQQYFQRNRQKSRTHVNQPTFLIKKSSKQTSSQISKTDQCPALIVDNKKKRGSLIDPKKSTKPPTTTALGQKIFLANMFSKDQQTADI